MRLGFVAVCALLAFSCQAADDERAGSPRLVDPAGYVALTYDDGPHPTYTPRLLDHLADYDAPATFFVLGSRANEHPDIVRREADDRHEVANHTYDHPNLLSLDDEQVWRQIRGTTEELNEAGVDPVLFRPPYDARDERIDEIVEDEGLTTVLWSYRSDPRDWDSPDDQGKPAAEVCELVLKRVQAGDVILLHDKLAGTVDATPCLVEGLRRKGLEPGRVVPAREPSEQNAGSPVRVVR
jgi:peptidoglycan/xylan/chitin deacetylase (PgdA/CDA1 family)